MGGRERAGGPLSWKGECILGYVVVEVEGGLGCQFLSAAKVCVAVPSWQGRGGVRRGWGGRGRQGGINLIKDTNAEPHWESKKKERGEIKKSHAGLPRCPHRHIFPY